MGFVFEKIICGILSPNSAETTLQNYICIVFYITVLLTTFNKKKRFEIYPKVSYTPNILPDVHVINFTKKKEQAVNSLDSKKY